MIWLFLFLAIILLLLLIAFVRTLLLKPRSTFYEYSKEEIRTTCYAEKLSKMVQFETVSYRGHPEPDKFRGFHLMLEYLFPSVFEHLEKIDIDGNLLMKWKGKDSSLEPIILISHQDVVPAEGKWTYPPFSGTIDKGRVWGRGAADIKSGVFAFYQAVQELLDAGYQPECDVYLGSSCTEEIGGDGAPKIVNWFKEHHIHLFMLSDEGGCIVENPMAGIQGTFAAIGVFEKGYGDIRFTARSKGGHSSTPPKNTPIVRLAKFEMAVEKRNPFKVKFSPAVTGMFKNLAPYCHSFPLKMVLANTWLFAPLLKLVLPRISPEAAAMLQTTIAFTMQKGSDGYNVLPQEAYVTANLRYIPHQDLKESNEIIMKLAKKYDLESTFITGNPSSKSMDLNGTPYQMTLDTIHRIFPGIGIMPYVVTGGTDSRFFDEVCDNCIRFTPVLNDSDQLSRMHGIDENITASVLPPAVDYFKALIKAQESRSGQA